MADISKCENTNCARRLECWRFTSKPSPQQAYTEFAPDSSGKCGYFWDKKEYELNETII